MRICQVTPGLISIPPNGWGAIEKIIWEYKLSLERAGHTCDILYLDQVKPDDYDVVHVHVGNLALLAHQRGIPYVFTMHDHHTEVYGSDSTLYKQNREAIEKSLVSFVPANHLVSYFNSKRVKYLRHGVNSSFFTYTSSTIPSSHKLLCVGRNGLAQDMSFDRKGFVYAIEAARKHNLPITIAGPSANKEFFEKNVDYKPYDKCEFIYDLNEEQLLKTYQNHTIFLHPSSVEAGHPNLTLVEAMACALPVVATYDSDSLPGMVKIERSVDSVYSGIATAMKNWELLRKEALAYARDNDWNNVVADMIGEYRRLDEYRMINQLNDMYDSTVNSVKQEQSARIDLDCRNGCQITISGGDPSLRYNFDFINDGTGENLFSGTMKTGEWSRCTVRRYIPYRVKVHLNDKVILDEKISLKGKNVLIALDTKSLGDCIAWFPYVEEFRKKHECNVFCATNWEMLFKEHYPNINFLPLNWSGNFFAIYNIGCYPDSQRSLFTYKEVTLQRLASSILGLDDVAIIPNTVVLDKTRKIKEKYVCFGIHSTAQAKFWNNPNGWQEVCNYLNSIGLKPVLVQKEEHPGFEGCINMSGKGTIHDTINLIYNSEFFLGLGSGLSWLAWSLRKPVVLISGFSLPIGEFFTPYRVINTNVCHGCWNSHDFDKGNWNWCPKHENTPRMFECSKEISSHMVIDHINKLIKDEGISTLRK